MGKSNNNNLGSVIDGIFKSEDEEQQAAEPQQEKVVAKRGPGRPKADGYERRTFQIEEGLFRKLKLIAAREGVLQKDLLDFILKDLIARYEKKNGPLEPEKAEEPKKDVSSLFY